MHVKPQLTGGEIAAMGAGQGPIVGHILDRLLKLKLEGKLPTRGAEVAYVATQLRGVRAQKFSR
jgi:hypothetical protein